MCDTQTLSLLRVPEFSSWATGCSTRKLNPGKLSRQRLDEPTRLASFRDRVCIHYTHYIRPGLGRVRGDVDLNLELKGAWIHPRDLRSTEMCPCRGWF